MLAEQMIHPGADAVIPLQSCLAWSDEGTGSLKVAARAGGGDGKLAFGGYRGFGVMRQEIHGTGDCTTVCMPLWLYLAHLDVTIDGECHMYHRVNLHSQHDCSSDCSGAWRETAHCPSSGCCISCRGRPVPLGTRDS